MRRTGHLQVLTMQLSKIYVAMAAFGLATLAGCSGDDGHAGRDRIDPDYAEFGPGSYSGQVLDGYLNNALVWIDLNNNRRLDRNEAGVELEPSVRTGAEGRFVFSKEVLEAAEITRPHAYPLMVHAIAGETIDEDQGVALERSFFLAMPAIPRGVYPLVTPLTTLLKLERDQATFDAAKQVYDDYTPPTEERVLRTNLELDHNNVRNKLGLARNLWVNYLRPQDPQMHRYAQVMVRAMQDYIETEGGLAGLEEGLAQEAIDRINNDTELDADAKEAKLAELLTRAVQSKLDALGRALVNQARWIIATVDQAAGENPTTDAYRDLTLADIEPIDLQITLDDPLRLYRKRIYVSTDSYASDSTPLTSSLVHLPFINVLPNLAQVQTYGYDVEGRIAEVRVAGDLHLWRHDLLVGYPIQLEALFPPQWTVDPMGPLDPYSEDVRVGVSYDSLNDATKTQTVNLAVDATGGEAKADGLVDETWHKTLTHLTGEAPIKVPEGIWLNAPMAKHGAGAVNVTAESFLGNDSLVALLTQPERNLTMTLEQTQVTPRILNYLLKAAGSEVVERRQRYETLQSGYNIHYGFSEGSENDVTAYVQNRQADRRESVRVDFTADEFIDYCVVSSYHQADGQLYYQSVQLLKAGTTTCDKKKTVMYVFHEFRRLSEVVMQ